MKLPTEKTKPKTDFGRLRGFLCGPSGFGKSTIASCFPKPLFLDTEGGLRHLSVYPVTIDSWEKMREAIYTLEKEKHGYQTIIVDTIDRAHAFCSEEMLTRYEVTHESDLGMGKGWSVVKTELFRQLGRLYQLGIGVWLISHTQEVEIRRRKREPEHRTKSSLPGKIAQEIIAGVDMVLLGEWEGDHRVLRTKPTAHYEAKDRTGFLPQTIRLSDNPGPEDYHVLVTAFEAGRQREAERSRRGELFRQVMGALTSPECSITKEQSKELACNHLGMPGREAFEKLPLAELERRVESMITEIGSIIAQKEGGQE